MKHPVLPVVLSSAVAFGCTAPGAAPTPSAPAGPAGSALPEPPASLEPGTVTFATPDGGRLHADLYGAGEHGVVLAHGGRFDKESWAKEARVLAAAGFRVLAFDFRGYGASRGGSESRAPSQRYAALYLDVLGAVRHLRASGATTVSVVGGSMGGTAAAEAAAAAEEGEIDRLVLLAPGRTARPERMQGRKLFVVAREDPYADGSPRLATIRDEYERAPEPKELLILDGAAHAQWIFPTPEGPRLMDAIVRFLSSP